MWRTELWRWTVKNCGSSSIFPFKLRHKWAIRASYRNSMHWTLKPGEKKNSREEKAWKRLLQWPVKWSSDTCAIINSDRSGLKKLEQKHCGDYVCDQVTNPLNHQRTPPGKDTDTTGQSGRSNTTLLPFRLDDWRGGLHWQDLKPKPKTSATKALYQPCLKHFWCIYNLKCQTFGTQIM